jgi:hypothetical protein
MSKLAAPSSRKYTYDFMRQKRWTIRVLDAQGACVREIAHASKIYPTTWAKRHIEAGQMCEIVQVRG